MTHQAQSRKKAVEIDHPSRYPYYNKEIEYYNKTLLNPTGDWILLSNLKLSIPPH